MATWVQVEVVPYEKHRGLVSVRGTIDRDHSSLVAALGASGENVLLAMSLADVFSGDIDFNNDLQPGDRFEIVFERLRIAAHGETAVELLEPADSSGLESTLIIFYSTCAYCPVNRPCHPAGVEFHTDIARRVGLSGFSMLAMLIQSGPGRRKLMGRTTNAVMEPPWQQPLPVPVMTIIYR